MCLVVFFFFCSFFHLCNFSGCESETDTEEFEKVGQSPVDRRKLADLTNPKSNEIATSTERIDTTTIETLTEVCITFVNHYTDITNKI